jgi:hypothetical protein
MLFKILGAPFSLPVAGFRFVIDQLVEMAETELYDEARIREDLLLLQVQFEEGSISEDEYVEAEVEIMARLRAAREFREARERAAAGDDEDDDETGVVIESW